MGLMEWDADEQLNEVDEVCEIPIPLIRRRQGGVRSSGNGQLGG